MNKIGLSLIRTLLTAAVLASSSVSGAEASPQVGLQSWTCRNMTFEQLVVFAGDHHIKYLQLCPKHIDPAAPREEALRKKAALDERGLVFYSFGVTRPTANKEENRKLFEFARLMGIKLIIVEPQDPAAWDSLEELVKEYDIRLAIHNHGRGTVYGDPAKVKEVLDHRDPRIGACIDIGHVTSAGFDVAKVFRLYGARRVYDLHLKDKRIEKSAEGQDVVIDVEIGTGAANLAELFAEIKRERWEGVMAIETDNPIFAQDPARYVESAMKFFRQSFVEKAP